MARPRVRLRSFVAPAGRGKNRAVVFRQGAGIPFVGKILLGAGKVQTQDLIRTRARVVHNQVVVERDQGPDALTTQ